MSSVDDYSADGMASAPDYVWLVTGRDGSSTSRRFVCPVEQATMREATDQMVSCGALIRLSDVVLASSVIINVWVSTVHR